jgi:hypothetical protein
MYRAACPETIEVALQVIEDHHVDLHLHDWVDSPDRGKWLEKYSYFFVLFLDGEYRGFAAVVNTKDGHYLHFGCVKSASAMRDILFSVEWLQCSLPRFYGIFELKCCIDSGASISKLVDKLGFAPEPDSDDTYTLTL